MTHKCIDQNNIILLCFLNIYSYNQLILKYDLKKRHYLVDDV